jgi:hypothetical protein
LHCSVCFHKYDDNLKRPKSLPCSHTFCLTCLQVNPFLVYLFSSKKYLDFPYAN